MASGHHCASISMIVFLLFGALLVCAQEMQADVVETPYEALLLDDDASVLKTLRLSASERSANATFVVPDEEFSFSALAPVNCLRGFKVDSKSSTLLSFSDIECKLEMLWMKENFYLTRDGIDADEGVSHLKSAVQVVIKKKIASYGAITVEGACDLKLTPNSNPNIEGKFVVNLSISRGQSTGPTCDIELDFSKYKYYKPPVSTESFGATKSSAGNTLLIIILSVVGAIVLLALLGIAVFCICKCQRDVKLRQKRDEEVCTAIPNTPLPPSPKDLPMTKAILSTTEVSWTFKTSRPKDRSPPPKEMYDKAYAYLDAKCRFKESDTSEGRRRMVYALLKKKQAWDYSPPGGSSDAKKHEPSTEASAEKKTAITKSQS